MDRTVIVPYRAEEKELSHILYNAIQGLTLLHPPTEDLRKCLSDEMFIKPNQHAFFHIMHYLFRILDPQEFKKRFFWPITDKRSESNFRTSTVEYLKHINEKYQLNWTNIKSYLVVMPGGMKFISFLLDFVNFIVQELIKQKEKQLNLDANQYRAQVSEGTLSKMCAKNEIFKCLASKFIDTLENLNTKYDDMSHMLMEQLEILSKETHLSVDNLMDDKFLDDFEESNQHLFNLHYHLRTKNVLEMDSLIGELKDAMDKFYTKESGYKYDKQRICLQLRRIRDQFSMEELMEESFGSKVADEGVNINTLITTFNAINDTIQNELKVLNQKPCAGEFVYSRLLNLKKELQEMEAQITDFKKMLLANMKKSSKTEFPQTPVRTNMNGPTKRNLENTLLMKLVSTPPIKFEVPEGGGKSRLSLIDNKLANANETTFNNFLAPPRATTIRQPNRHHSLIEQSISELNTANRSKIIDPIQLLRSTSKKDSSKYKTTTPQINISNLATKWKQHQSMFNDSEQETPVVPGALSVANTPKTHLKPINMSKTSPHSFTTASTTMLHQSPFTPFGSNDHTRIARSQYQLDTSIAGGGNNSGPVSLNYIKKLSAVKKVQDASLNFANLSTSPSGRLEPLVTAEDLDIPKLKLNDISLIDHNLGLNNSMVFEKPKLLVNSTVADINIDAENNPNTNNISLKKLNESVDKHDSVEDALFNISDSVLKDVTL